MSYLINNDKIIEKIASSYQNILVQFNKDEIKYIKSDEYLNKEWEGIKLRNNTNYHIIHEIKIAIKINKKDDNCFFYFNYFQEDQVTICNKIFKLSDYAKFSITNTTNISYDIRQLIDTCSDKNKIYIIIINSVFFNKYLKEYDIVFNVIQL